MYLHIDKHIGVEVYSKKGEFLGYLFYKYDGQYYRVGTNCKQSLNSIEWVLENKECLVILTADLIVKISSIN